MSKVMKKIIAFCFMAVLTIAMIPQTIKADEATDAKKAVYVQVPQDWENPCVWAWDDDGNNAFEAWPGEEMEADSANEGWYYIWVPTWANHVIVNANDGNVQTAEQVLDGEKDCWITVTDADNAEVTYDKQTTGETPEYVEKFAIHAKVDAGWENPCLWAWSAPDGTNVYSTWPGEAFEEEENGWLKKEVPGWVNSVIVNGNEGSVQTTDISVESGKDLWLVVNGPEDYMVYYEEPAADETAQTAETAENVEESTETLAEENTENSEGSNMIIWIIGGVVVVAAVATGIVVKNKKKTAA